MHLLSKIKFTFKNGFTSKYNSLMVTDIKISGAPLQGNIDVNKQQRTDYKWVLADGQITELSFGDANVNDVNGKLEAAPIAIGEKGYSQYERLTIPAEAGYVYTISFDLALYNGTQKGATCHKEIVLDNQTFEIGKNYNLVATIDASNFEDLTPIEFDAIEVLPWIPADAEALDTPKVTATVKENVVTLTWEAIANAEKYSVAIGNQAPVFVDTTTYTFTGEYETEYTFTVIAIPAENSEYTNSAVAIVTATTEAKAAAVASEWALVGAFSSWTDKTMLTTADADVVVLEDVALKAADGFLVRKPSTDWADKYGAGNVNYLKANHYITTVKEGADMCVEADGTYDVYFNISTKNLYVMEADVNYAEATEQTVNGEEPKQEEPEVTEKVVYLKPNANWTTDGARFAAYFWNDTANAWVSMTAIEDGIYQVNLPEGYDYGCNVIFCRMNPSTTANNWNNKWNQTGDLKVPTDGKNLFTLAASAWDGATTSWSVYTPAAAPAPVALATPVVATTVDVNVITLKWEAIEGASHYTVQVDDDVEEVVNDTTYRFEGDYEVEYTFTVKAIAADTTKNLDSEGAVVTATTEAKPVVEPEVLAELDADAYYIYKQATEMKGGKWYAIVYENKAATGVTGGGEYGYLKVTEAASRANGISLPATCAFGFLTTEGGYTIQQFDGKYVYQTGTYNSFNVNANLPAEGGVWSVAANGNEYTITNNTMSKFVQYDPNYNSFGCYATVNGSLPTLYELVEVDNTPAILGVSPSSLSFAADGESKTITVSTYGVATLTVNENADWVSTSMAENIVTVTVDANTGEARETTLTLSYGDDSQVVTIAQVAPSTGESYTVTYDFTQINGFSSWTSSYSEHTVEYNEAIVCFEKANRQTTNITNMPVTKGNSVTLVAKNNATITAAAFECQQWTTKAQTITLYYSTDGGNTYTSTNITSTNFSIESSTLPEGTNAVKIGFSSTSNQVGIKSATITYK